MEIYIHIPFCMKKCAYCDFLSFEVSEQVKKQYVRKLKEEIETDMTECMDESVSSVFIGGGTPSVLSGDAIQDIMKTVYHNFPVLKEAEITLEANPGSVSPEKIGKYKEAGINRLSFGLQSAQDEELELLGRIHSMRDFEESFQIARKAGFGNINVDLMSALPGQTVKSWCDTLEAVARLRPEHISAYSLIIEENTPFYTKYAADIKKRETGGKSRFLPSEEEERRMYRNTEDVLSKYGYERYEISNYALPGYSCRHNQGYWGRVNYLGFGLGASSCMKNKRFRNTADLQQYLKGNFTKEDCEYLSREAQMEEYMFLGLRMNKGISITAFEKEFECAFAEIYGRVTEKLIADKLLSNQNGRLILTERGIDLSNYVLAQFLF